jgi:hypothetical protein
MRGGVALLAATAASTAFASERAPTACPDDLRILERAFVDSRTGPASSEAAREQAIASADARLAQRADAAFADFLAGRLLPPPTCGRDATFAARLREAVASRFYAGGIAALASSGAEAPRAFAARVTETFGTSYIPGFRVFAEWPATGPSLPAGFDRGSGAVFVRLGSVDRGKFFTYFVHEMAHALDTRLKRAERAHARAGALVGDLAAWMGGGGGATRDTDADGGADSDASRRASLDAFAWVDLERGYLAEVRAWKDTLAVVSALPPSLVPRNELTFLDVPFGAVEPLDEPTLAQRLGPRFVTPRTGFYANAPAREALERARASIAALAASGRQGWEEILARSEDAFGRVEKE